MPHKNYHKLKGIAFYFFLFVVSHGYSQSAINYSISQGLPSNEVYSIYQDSEGFLWFATDNGVVRYDGAELKILHVKDGLSDPVVFSFHEDVEKRIWFRTYSGKLSYFDPKSEKIETYKFNDKIAAIVKNGLILAISTDKLENLYISITGYTIKIDKNGTVTRKEQPHKSFIYQELESESLLGLNPKDEKIEIAIINDHSFPIQLSQKQLINHVACSLTINEKVLFTIGNDLFEYSDNKVKKVFTGRYSIISLSKDKKGDLWIGYFNKGVEIVKSETYKSEYFNLFRKKSVTKVLQDIENGYWFSTLETGIYYLPNKNIDTLNYTKNTKIKSAILAYKDIVTGDQNGYLHFLDVQTRKEKEPLYLGAPVMSIFKDVQSKLWVSTNLEVLILDTLNKIQKRISPLTKIDFTKDGNNHVWGTGAFNTLFDLDGNRIKDFKAGTYRSILIKDSLIILAGKIGIEIRDKNFNLIDSPEELDNVKIRKIDLLNDTTLLLSSAGNGPILFHLKTLSTELLTTTKKFPAYNIYATIKEDSSLWLGTEKGIFKIDGNLLSKKPISFDHLSKQSGLLNDKIDFLVKVNENIWAFSDDGVCIIPPTKTDFENQKPKFYIKDLFVNKKKVDLNKEIALPYYENYLRLDVGFISFNNRNIKIRFKLSDRENWSYTDNHSIELFSLSSGNYNINLEYSTDGINWAEAIKNLKIDIRPPWWQIWYMQLAIFLFITLCVIFFIMTRVSLIRQKQIYLQSLTDHQQQLIHSEIESIEKERSRIAKDLHDGIGTTLTSIKMGINQVMNKYNQDEADDVENRLQDVLKEVKNIIHDLTPPALMQFGLHEGLRNYIEKISGDTHVHVKLDIFGEEIKQPKINLFVFRIIQELVINSLKHSNAKNITIHLSAFDDLLNILYEDDGIGFAVDEVTRGNGLYNIESRIQALQGKILFETSSKGVSYSIDIPLV